MFLCDELVDDLVFRCMSVYWVIYLIFGVEIESCMFMWLFREMNYVIVIDGLIIFILRRKVSLLDLYFFF